VRDDDAVVHRPRSRSYWSRGLTRPSATSASPRSNDASVAASSAGPVAIGRIAQVFQPVASQIYLVLGQRIDELVQRFSGCHPRLLPSIVGPAQQIQLGGKLPEVEGLRRSGSDCPAARNLRSHRKNASLEFRLYSADMWASCTAFAVFAWFFLVPQSPAQTAHDPVPDLGIGKRIFESQCTVCHGQGGTRGRGPALTRPVLVKAPDDAALRKLIADGLPPEMPGSWQLSVREVASVAAYVRLLGSVAPEVLPGNPERGAAVYRAKGCAGCHIVSGQGNGNGPELTAIGARRNAAYLRQSLRSPAASLPDQYMVVQAVTAAGRAIRGIRANEDPFTLQLWDAATGNLHSLRKSDLRELRHFPSESTMPAYPESALPAAELEDLVAYLASLRGGSR